MHFSGFLGRHFRKHRVGMARWAPTAGRRRGGGNAAPPPMVVDGLTGEEIGYAVNISETGMQVHGRIPVDTSTGHVFALEVLLPGKPEGKERVAVSARSVWFMRDPQAPQSKFFRTGFELVNTDARCRELWKSVVARCADGR